MMRIYPYPPLSPMGEPEEDDFMNTSSASDCTGLIPAAPDSDDLYGYAGLYDFLPPEPPEERR